MVVLGPFDVNSYEPVNHQTDESAPWRAVYCVGGQEIRALGFLKEQGFTAFCPHDKVTKRRQTGRLGGLRPIAKAQSFQNHTVDVPVFPGYLFVKTNALAAVERIGGVLTVVRVNRQPLSVPDRVVERLQSAADADGVVKAIDISKISFSFPGKVGGAFDFKRGSPLFGMMGFIASLESLDDTGEIRAWIQMLGGPRDVKVHYTTIVPRALAA